jgi:carboxypeptidase T
MFSRAFIWISLIAFVLPLASGSAVEKYSRVKIFVSDRSVLDRIWSTGIDPEGCSGKVGGMMEFVAGPREVEKLQMENVPFEVVVNDLVREYEERQAREPHSILAFGSGSMGGHYTYVEVLRVLDSMRTLYPSLITVRDSIGRTQEGRGIWAVKISDNPAVNEPGEPELLYTGLHHAREPMGMMSCLYYMWWLMDNYGTNSEATYLVNNRQMWFIPVVNPDGYVYNQSTNPSGGGMWRKNRRNNGTSYGVDLNRNYGPYYMWNSQIVPNGSSTDPTSDTYRGPSQFSEPETQAIDNFMRAHTVKACLNYHTYGNYFVYPWGYNALESADSLVYRDWAYTMTATNKFTNGTDMQTVAYGTRGGSDDYMFGDTTKPIAYSVTPEVGISGFWAGQSEIIPLAAANLGMNQMLAHIGGHYAVLARYSVVDAGGNGFIDRGESFSLVTTIRNRGVAAASNISYTISSGSSDVQFTGSTATLATLARQSEAPLTFTGYAASNATIGAPVQFFLTATDAEGYLRRDTMRVYLGTPTIVFADSASSGTGNWTTGTGWGLTSTAHSLPTAFTDSPSGSYAASSNNALTLSGVLSTASYNYVQLKFWTKWGIEPTWDFGTVEASSNNGTTWTTLRTELSHSASARSGSQQPTGTWGFDSYTPGGQQYIEQEADLTPFKGAQLKIRFRMAADGGDQRDGIYVDDIRVYGHVTNSLPTPPMPLLVSPVQNATNIPLSTILLWRVSSGALGYRVQLAADSLFGSIVVDDSSLVDTSRSVSGLVAGTAYFWRVSAKNAAGSSGFTAQWKFTTIPPPPGVQTLQSPPDGATGQSASLTCVWRSNTGATRYHFQLSTDPLFGTFIVNDSLVTDTLHAVSGLAAGQTAYWRVRGINVAGAGPWSGVWHFTTANIVSRQYPFASGWNLVSVPLSVADARRTALYPEAISTAFAFVQSLGYVMHDTLLNGVGYWLRFGAAGNAQITGIPFASDTVSVIPGWNLIGSPSAALDTASVLQVPPGLVGSAYFQYNGSYLQSDSLRPGNAYWVKALGTGTLILGNAGRRNDSVAPHPHHSSEK